MLSEKSLVLYKNQVAFIKERDGDKYLIEFSGGSKKVRDKDIEFLHKGPITSLKDICAYCEKIFSSIQLKSEKENLIKDVWELMEGEKTSFSQLIELISTDIHASEVWMFYCLLLETPWFSGDITGFIPRSLEEIEEIKKKENEKEHEQEIRQEFLSRLKKKQINLPDDGKFMQDIEALALGKTDKSRTMKDIGFKETQEKAHKLLLDTGHWQIYRNPHPSRYGLSMMSADEQLASPPEEERLDLTSIPSWAIDNEWSDDPDDAISFDGEYLWIHVADPASTVVPDSPIDIAARNRGATLYIPEGTSRMLAEKSLADYALGLSPLSYALSFRIQFDESGAIIESKVFKTRIKVTRLTYQQTDEMMFDSQIAPLFEIAKRNIIRREKSGAVSIELPEVFISVHFDGTNPDIQIIPVKHFESSAMVREMMLLAGEASARFAFKNNIPFLYVSQDQPDIPGNLPEGLAGQYRLRRSMKGRRVGVTPSDHAGLGLGMYSQVTSPLRRYGDLIAHQQLRFFINGEKPLNRDSMLERISMGDAAAQAAVKAERASNLHWTLVWLTYHPEWIGDGVVVEIKDKHATLFIPELARETQIILKNQSVLNDVIKIKAININIPELTLMFAEV